jgi:glycosyltransferase involved in cell wall biosynthesis
VSDQPAERLRIAAIVPCYNEEVAVASVVRDLRGSIPNVEVYVYDNASTDGTRQAAVAAGAHVRTEERRGKGNVVRRAFADIDADVYLLIDGDGTYDATRARTLVDTLLAGPYDHVVGVREEISDTAYRVGHAAGNRLLNRITSLIFRSRVTDMLSGYRVFSRRFVKSFPALSREFEIETELTIHAMGLRVPQREVPVGFTDRPIGSESKLRTFRDGFRILGTILRLAHYERPALAYGFVSLLLVALGLVLGLPVVAEYLRTGLVPRFPTAFLASSLMVLSAISLIVGLLQDAVRRSREESSRLWYLSFPSVRPA